MDFLINTNVCTQGDSLLIAFKIARWVVRILQFAVPFALIIFGSLDFFKAVIAGDEKEMKAKRKPFVQRVIAAVLVLILPTLVNLIITNVVPDSSTFKRCWDNANPKGNISIPNNGFNTEA